MSEVSDHDPSLAGSDLRAQLSLSLGAAYFILRELEGGGISRVFLAHEEELDRDVVIKVLPPELTRELSAERFEREMRILSSLDEPHAVPVLSAAHTSGELFYYIMPYVNGESLRQKLLHGPVGFDDSVSMLRDVARALDYVHAKGVVHRNLKPEKVIVLRHGAVVTDFGVAHALEMSITPDTGEMGILVDAAEGPLGYMAPEQIAGDSHADHRVDIYAWGVMAHELLFETHPFAAPPAHVEESADASATDTPPVVVYKRFGVPEQLAVLVMRCLERDPAARPANAAELLTVLDRIPVRAAALAIESEGTARWIGASIIAGLVLFVLSAVGVWRMQSSEGQLPPLVAVLPFESGGVVNDSLFAAGLGDGINGKLTMVSGLRVIDRKSVLTIPDAAREALAAGRILGADYVLGGTVRWIRDAKGVVRARVSPVLLRVSDSTSKWQGEPEMVTLADPFSIQTSVAEKVVQLLGVVLQPREKAALAMRPTRDTAAYSAFTRGNKLYRLNLSHLRPDYSDALREFEHAYQLDPLYADALGSAAAALARMDQVAGTVAHADSVTILAHRALAQTRGHARALVALALVALAQDRPDDAQSWVERAVSAYPSSIEALELRAMVMPIVGDSLGTWRDAERLAELGPRSADALVAAATGAQQLRRFKDAGDLLQRARVLEPDRTDLILRSAMLARVDGDFPAVARAVRAYRLRGGAIGPSELTLLRVGDPSMQKELANASPSIYRVKTRADSFDFYSEKARLFLALRNRDRAHALLDSSAAVLRLILADTAMAASELRKYTELMAWTDAARGQRSRALAAMNDVARTPIGQQWPNGQFAAFTACNGAEIYGFLDIVDLMLPQLRRCLTLPGGYATSAFFAEPALARHMNDPRVRALLGELELELGRTI
jgi:serine/threonine protein kinase/tetratricopeptide (TPR) repeat protein